MNQECHVPDLSDFSGASFSVRLGRFFFRSRNFISAPIFLFLLGAFFWEHENEWVSWFLGPVAILTGEALRMWAMRHIGRSARTRKDKAEKLVVKGPYAYIRNPLYVGNHVVLLGFCLLSELLWFAPVALAICFAFYSFISTYEEYLMTRRFGEDYLEYSRRVPRWVPVPRLRNIVDGAWREAFYRERTTVFGIMFGVAAFGVKEIISRAFFG
jgi:protein-S-isoprenylcysteine O-methyltransferase Ste14